MGPGLADALTGPLRSLPARVGVTAATVVGTAVLVQIMLSLGAGDAADLAGVTPDQREMLLEQWGLAGTAPARAVAAVTRLLAGELGASMTVAPGAPVAELAVGAWCSSLPLLIIGTVLGVAGAAAAAVAPRTAAVVGALRVLSAPPAFVATLVAVHGLNTIAFAAWQAGADQPDWFPLPHSPSLLRTGLAVGLLGWSGGALGAGAGRIAAAARRVRHEPWFESIQVQGRALGPVLARALVPELLSLGSAQLLRAAGTLVVVEKLLGLEGAGQLLWAAAVGRDLGLVAGLTVGFVVVVSGLRLLMDLTQRSLTPRSRWTP